MPGILLAASAACYCNLDRAHTLEVDFSLVKDLRHTRRVRIPVPIFLYALEFSFPHPQSTV
jgi:hypothetical protein